MGGERENKAAKYIATAAPSAGRPAPGPLPLLFALAAFFGTIEYSCGTHPAL